MPALLLKMVADAVGFFGGALAGYWLARAFGVDLLRDAYGNGSVLAIAAVGLFGGIGLGAARRWRAARDQGTEP